MNGATARLRFSPRIRPTSPAPTNGVHKQLSDSPEMIQKKFSSSAIIAKNVRCYAGSAHFLKWTAEDVYGTARNHPLACAFAACVLFFMVVEYTLNMVPPTAPPFDLGFVATAALHRSLASKPDLNTLLAGLNTVFVGMQTAYIIGTFVVEGRPRATLSALFMFTCRGILGYVTQLPLPQEFLGSGADFPVGNVSFFLFYSGHVAASVIASLDMRRMRRWELAYTFDVLNVLQVIRLLTTRGHYTIDLAVGVGAGILFDSLAEKYEHKKKEDGVSCNETLQVSQKHDI